LDKYCIYNGLKNGPKNGVCFLGVNIKIMTLLFYGYNKKILDTLTSNPWALLATWLNLEAPQKLQEK
jgi:hypothetical protein